MGSCFVIMGFGEKTDFQSNPQRVLNLNMTYANIIKPAVEETGHTCIRADEIIHSTVIDKPMYDNLLSADLVIADLSTANANAIYELGVRHALRPHRTIVMAENNFSFPFDLNHLSILKYEHLGKDIGFSEVMRVKQILKTKIATLMGSPEVDSPVFLFIPSLQAPILLNLAVEAPPLPALSSAPTDKKSFAELLVSFRAAKSQAAAADDWAVPLGLLNRLKTMQPDDPYILQQLALATYKFEQPDKKAALIKAQGILSKLAPQTSSDAETVGLWGAIHKRLWAQTKNRDDLNESAKAYGRGYYIKNDYYNGINYAFMLDLRASQSASDDALVDHGLAKRIRNDVLSICDQLLEAVPADQQQADSDELFWIEATKVEALFGLGRKAEAEKLKIDILDKERKRLGDNQAKWNGATLLSQLDELAKLLPP
jgi:tetratricopeptide repeat protein